MPLSLKIIPVGERESLADFQKMEPEPAAQAIHGSEYEDTCSLLTPTRQRPAPVGQNAQQLALPGRQPYAASADR